MMNELEMILQHTDFGSEIANGGPVFFTGFPEGSKFFADQDGFYYGFDPVDRLVHTYLMDGDDLFAIRVESFDGYIPIP